jgi:hypothetical protein
MLKTVHIKTSSLEDNGTRASGFFTGVQGSNVKTIVDGEALSKEIEKEGNKLISMGYQILSILPVTSQKLEGHGLHATYTSSVIITAVKT